MKNKSLLILAVLLPLSVFNMNADENEQLPHVKEIPVNQVNETKLNRSLYDPHIKAYYFDMLSCIQTIALSDIGEVSVTVINCSTGESWYESFDSAAQPQTFIQISGTPGLYQVTYITENGDVYEGNFNIK